MITDLRFISLWLFMFLGISLIIFPLLWKIFKNLADGGLSISLAIGMLFPGWLTWFLASVHWLKFSFWSALGSILTILILSFITVLFNKRILRNWISLHRKILVFEVFLFSAAFVGWSLVRGFQPDIQGLEKFMDAGFVNSIIKSGWMPPPDPWLAGNTINYYYFGHFLAAFSTVLSGIDPAIAYNLLLATVFAQGIIGGFGVIFNFLNGGKPALIAGLVGTLMLNFGGNLQTLWHLLFQPEKPYWYPDATRFIPFTIHEFPAYSHVVADLHGHLMNFPLVLTFLVILVGFINILKVRPSIGGCIKYLIPLGFLLGIFIMTNAWDFPIYGLVLAIIVARSSWLVARGSIKSWLKQILPFGTITALTAIVVSLPFTLNFKNIIQGIALVETRSPLWQLGVLWGGFAVIGLVAVWRFLDGPRFLLGKNLLVRPNPPTCRSPAILPFVLVFVSFLLIVIPEFIYVKDIYIKDYHRANTMFKLTYQSFVMMSLVFGVTLGSLIKEQKTKNKKQWLIVKTGLFLLLLVFSAHMLYPFYAIKSYYNGLKEYRGLHGLQWLARAYPDDYQILLWLKNNVNGQPVILEAVGESYTDFSRMSAFSGLPTVLGWRVHEWLWRGGFDIPAQRTEEVRRMFESPFDQESVKLFNNYKIRYIVIGDLERKTYKIPDRITDLGKVVFQFGDTKIIEFQ